VLRLHRRILAVFPEAMFIHVYRDGRAVVSSMVRSERPYFAGERMGRGDVVYAARYWRDYTNRIKALQDKGEIRAVNVKYEAFCQDPERILRDTMPAVGLVYRQPAASGGADAFRIAEKEEKIHNLAGKDPVLDRLNGWQHELAPWQGLVIEMIERKSLDQWGYAPHFRRVAKKQNLLAAVVRAWAVHAWLTVAYYGKRCAHYWGRWGNLRKRINLVITEKMNG
jgi:hypothetical protein